MSQNPLDTSKIEIDPLFRHVYYCCLDKEQRSLVVTNLISELTFHIPVEKLRSMWIYTAKTWEAVLTLIPQGVTRNDCYTRVLDCGASFSDGTDGIEWGAAMGLSYHGVPATRILAMRRSPDYCGQQLTKFRDQIASQNSDPKKITLFWNQLQRQLSMIGNSTDATKNSRSKVEAFR